MCFCVSVWYVMVTKRINPIDRDYFWSLCMSVSTAWKRASRVEADHRCLGRCAVQGNPFCWTKTHSFNSPWNYNLLPPSDWQMSLTNQRRGMNTPSWTGGGLSKYQYSVSKTRDRTVFENHGQAFWGCEHRLSGEFERTGVVYSLV